MLHTELDFQCSTNALGGSLVIVLCLFQKFPHAVLLCIEKQWKLSESRYWGSNANSKAPSEHAILLIAFSVFHLNIQ